MVSLPTSGAFATYMNSFFGNLSQSDREELWGQFITANGYSTIVPPDASSIPDQTKFIQFAETIFQNNQGLALSPDEVKKRKIMFTTFEVLIEMLTTMQQTVSVQGNNLVFYGKWQEQYTNAMARVPIYVGDASGDASIPTTVSTSSLGSFTLGYDSISIKDIANTMGYYQTNDTSYDFGFINNNQSGPTPAVGEPGSPVSIGINFYVNKPGFDGSSTPQSYVEYVGPQYDASGTQLVNPPPIQVLVEVDDSVNTQVAFANNVSNFQAAFVTLWNTAVGSNAKSVSENLGVYATSQSTTLAKVTPSIPWQHYFVYTGTDTNLQAASQTASRQRAELNAKNQQFIQNLTGYRSIIQNLSQQVQSNLSVTKDSIANQGNTLDSLITTLQSLISAIFK